LDFLGATRENVQNFLSKPWVSIPVTQKQEDPRQVALRNKLAEFVANAIPYDVSLAEMALGMATTIKPVYHGSPYKFTKFSNEKIGTGEGAQAFGYGHYLTESQAIAKRYSNTTLPEPRHFIKGIEVSKGSPEAHAVSLLQGNKTLVGVRKEVDGWIKEAEVKNISNPAMYDIDHYHKVKKVLDELKSKSEVKTSMEGNIYETSIHEGKQPGEYNYLEWDKPTSNKVDQITSRLKLEKINAPEFNVVKNYSGEAIYRYISKIFGSDKEASSFLKRAGVDGIKYPTGSLSGMKDTRKYNYVVFDPEDITIKNVNALNK